MTKFNKTANLNNNNLPDQSKISQSSAEINLTSERICMQLAKILCILLCNGVCQGKVFT